MYKMLVTDFDGTLLDKDEAIPLSTMLEVDRIRKNGILLTIATGRVMESVLEYNRDFPFIDYIISCSGAYIYDVKKNKVVYKKNIMASIIKKIKKLCDDYDICFCTDKYWYLLKGRNTVDRKLEDREILITDFNAFYEENKTNIYKIEILCDKKKARDNIYSTLEELNLKIFLNKVLYTNKQYGIEITMSDIDKNLGVEKICKLTKINTDSVIAIGDDISDLSMIKSAGMGVAVSNAVSEVKKIAKMKTTSNDTKGVEKVIKKLL